MDLKLAVVAHGSPSSAVWKNALLGPAVCYSTEPDALSVSDQVGLTVI